MKSKTKFFDISKIDRIIYLHGLLQVITSEIAYYHVKGEFDELTAEFYACKGEPKPSGVVVF